MTSRAPSHPADVIGVKALSLLKDAGYVVALRDPAKRYRLRLDCPICGTVRYGGETNGFVIRSHNRYWHFACTGRPHIVGTAERQRAMRESQEEIP
jgi:hypothetical protein